MSNLFSRLSSKKNKGKKTLVLFAFRDNYDVYVNIMARAMDEYEGLEKIVIVNLIDTLVDYQSKFKRKTLIEYTDKLSKGIYTEVTRNVGETIHHFTLPAHFQHYTKITELLKVGEQSKHHRTISFNEVNENLESIIKDCGKDAIYDLTTVPTRMNLQLFFACVALEVRKIHFFELRRKDLANTIDARLNNLYHKFPNDEEYFDYKNLTKTPTFQKNLAKLDRKPKKTYLYLIIIAIILSTATGIYFIFQEPEVKIYLIIFQVVSVAMMIYSLAKTWGKK